MDLGCLASIGALLLLLGVALLVFERVRQRQGNAPYPFPDFTTSLIGEDVDPDSTPVQPRPATFPISGPKSKVQSLKSIIQNLPLSTSGGSKPTLQSPTSKIGSGDLRDTLRRIGTGTIGRSQKGRAGGRPVGKGAVVFAAFSALIFALVVITALVTTAGPQTVPAPRFVIGLVGFVDQTLGQDLKARLASDILASERSDAAASGRGEVAVKLSAQSPTTMEMAEAERARLGADFLLWGDVGASGAITATLIFAPNYSVGQERWQRYTDLDTAALIFPQQARIYLTAGAGTDPLVPLSLALARLKGGNYQAASTFAYGSQATLDEGNGSGQLARFVQAVANVAGGQPDKAITLYSQMEEAGTSWPETLVNRGVAYLKLSQWAEARGDAERAIASRDSSDRALSRANLVRARARYRAGLDLTQAVSDLDESLRLNPDYALARLDKAEALYLQSQPDAARSELETLLARVPDAAPAYRLLGLVRLMLAQPEEALSALSNASRLYSDWIGALRSEEGRAQVAGDAARAQIATEGILALNRELAGVYLYEGMAWADKARKEPPESFLGGVWRNIRGEATHYERAIGKMQEAARLDPRRSDIPVQLGSLYVQMGDTGRGAQALTTAREIDPTAPGPYLALAQLQEAQRNVPEAIKTIAALTANSGRYYPAYEELYRLYSSIGDTQSAAGSLQRALQFAPQSPSDHLWRGKFLRLLGSPAEAEGEFRAALASPDLWEARVHLGEMLQEANRRPEALAEFKEALAVQPNDPRALLGAAKLMVLAGQTAEAEQLFSRLSNLAPGNVEGHIAFSQLLFGKGDLVGAIEQGKQAVAADPSRSDAHFYLGLAYEARGEWAAAIEQFNATIERNPSHFEALIRLSRALFFEDRYAEVIEIIQKAIELRGDDPQPYKWKAAALNALGDRTGALQSLGRSLQLSPQYVEALALASQVYAEQGDFASALNLASGANQADPRNPSGQLAAGEAYLRQGGPSEALQAFEGALATGLQKPYALTGKGRAYALAGDSATATKLFGDALALDPNFAEANLYAGDTYAQLSNWDEALRQYSRAVQLRPRWAPALYAQGKAFLQRGDTSNALSAFEKAVVSVPNYAEAWAGRGIAYRNRGSHRDATAALLKATQINPTYADAWLLLGLTSEEMGDRAQALQAFTQAINAATTDAIRQQAESGLQRVK